VSDADPALQQQPYANFQYEIYAGGLAGQTPPLPLRAAALEARAREILRPEAFDYVAGGAAPS
jgi:lactate 2-monooxygenase